MVNVRRSSRSKMGAFLSPLGLPCQQPPWGYFAGVDLTTGKLVDQHVNGTVRDLAPIPLPFEMGVRGSGGPIISKGGLAFLSGTMDYYVLGYDLNNGKEIWHEQFPAGGRGDTLDLLWGERSPSSCRRCGGHGSTGTKAGDAIIAYAFPKG